MSLRGKLIKLAFKNPELRDDLMPVITGKLKTADGIFATIAEGLSDEGRMALSTMSADDKMAILDMLAGPYKARPPWPDDPGGQGKPGKKNEYNLHNDYGKASPSSVSDPAGYAKKWREEWQGKHTDRSLCPDGYGDDFKCK